MGRKSSVALVLVYVVTVVVFFAAPDFYIKEDAPPPEPYSQGACFDLSKIASPQGRKLMKDACPAFDAADAAMDDTSFIGAPFVKLVENYTRPGKELADDIQRTAELLSKMRGNVPLIVKLEELDDDPFGLV